MSSDRAYGHRLDHLAGRLRLASAPTTEVFANIIDSVCTRLPIPTNAGKATRIQQLIEAGAQIDAALALIEIEIPQWLVRRLALDNGQWYCSLTRQTNLPIGLDDTADGQHEHVVLAILAAFVEALRMSRVAREPTVAAVSVVPTAGDPICCDNFS